MNTAIKNMLESLRRANPMPIYEHKQYLNDVAVTLYNKPQLNKEDIEDLKDILTIANITYNDTDREVLPIEDGFYDLLLEKYKKYDPHFQVGAEVIHFNDTKNDIYTEKPLREAVIFEKKPDQKECFFANNIIIDERKYIDYRDVENAPIPPKESYISKRLHDTEHNHPELVGTLDKCKFVLDTEAADRGVLNDANVKTVERDFFGEHLKSGIINFNTRFDMALELKYDGISVEADCTDEVVSARSRGDTGIGKASDLTPILKGYKFPHRPKGSPMVGVKFEAIITQYDLPYFNAAKGNDYKNCRSAIVGLFSSSDAWKYRDFITLVPLAVEKDVYVSVCGSNRVREIEYLNTNFVSKGCPLRYATISGNYLENLAYIRLFTQNAESSRSWVPFMYDGIVVSYIDENIRQRLGRENYINKFSVAVKFNPLRKQTVFRGYSFTVGQDGSITPMIHYDPVEFYGTIHPKSSGHSYARFKELDLRVGDIIDVEYVNDVMPYVFKPLNEFNSMNNLKSPVIEFPSTCPICGAKVEISESGKSAKCINPICGGRQLARMVNMCAKLGLEGFGEATISQLGCFHLKDLGDLLMSENIWFTHLGEKGFGPIESANMVKGFTDLIKNGLLDSVLLGSIGFSNISTKTWELILPKISYETLRDTLIYNSADIEKCNMLIDNLKSIKGIGMSTVETITRELPFFVDDIEWMMKHANIIKYRPTAGKKIRATGFRDKIFFEYLRTLGFDADDNASITKETDILLVPSEGHISTKTQTAAKYGVMIVPIDEFKDNVEKYL